jgi:hypothetical protein
MAAGAPAPWRRRLLLMETLTATQPPMGHPGHMGHPSKKKKIGPPMAGRLGPVFNFFSSVQIFKYNTMCSYMLLTLSLFVHLNLNI